MLCPLECGERFLRAALAYAVDTTMNESDAQKTLAALQTTAQR